MMDTSFQTPVLFVIFNRPDRTQKVFNMIRKVRPKQLFIAADGPRKEQGEAEESLCRETRNIITCGIDWECEVRTLFRNENLGCRKSVSQAITWFFEHVEQGIILEDDCLPHPTFFTFCECMLQRYVSNDKIMHISGTNYQFGIKRGRYSYYFSHYPHVWGWATWRRAWKLYDGEGVTWPKGKKMIAAALGEDTLQYRVRVKIYDDVFIHGKFNSWAYPWSYSCFLHQGLSISPNINLVSNIGFGIDSTHTKAIHSHLAYIQVRALPKKLKHPKCIQVNKVADQYTFNRVSLLLPPHFMYRLKRKIKLIVSKIL